MNRSKLLNGLTLSFISSDLSDEPFYFRMGMTYSGSSVARQMADETGGREVEIRSEKNLEGAFALISEELRSQFVLGYYPSNTKRDGTFRKVKVEVARSRCQNTGAQRLLRPGKITTRFH